MRRLLPFFEWIWGAIVTALVLGIVTNLLFEPIRDILGESDLRAQWGGGAAFDPRPNDEESCGAYVCHGVILADQS